MEGGRGEERLCGREHRISVPTPCSEFYDLVEPWIYSVSIGRSTSNVRLPGPFVSAFSRAITPALRRRNNNVEQPDERKDKNGDATITRNTRRRASMMRRSSRARWPRRTSFLRASTRNAQKGIEDTRGWRHPR